MKLAVGFFDGVHLGHRAILGNADGALTFLNHPSTVLAPERAPGLLTENGERFALMGEALRGGGGAERVAAVEFTKELAGMAPEEFAGWLRGKFPGLEEVHCGGNWRFGAGGRGNAETLRAAGLKVVEGGMAEWGGAAVSSTRIREALRAGKVGEANAMLGRRHGCRGVVESGKGEGRGMGWPTLNLRLPAGVAELRRGVYAGVTEWGGAAVNWGLAPTMGERAWKEPRMEVHLLEAGEIGGDLAGREVRVELAGFVREEREFGGVGELAAQIARDVEECRRILV